MSVAERARSAVAPHVPRGARRAVGTAAERLGSVSGDLRVAPSFVIAGVQRGGTNSLYEYLARHPLVLRARPLPEVHYFDLHATRSGQWYRGHFPTRRHAAGLARRWGGHALAGESSPYYIFHPAAMRRLAATLPNVRVLVLLRDPVARAFSHYHHERARGYEHLSFIDALAAEDDRLGDMTEAAFDDPSYRNADHQHFSYAARGRYDHQLARAFGLFRREQVLVVVSEDLFARPAEVHREALAFLGLPGAAEGGYPAYNRGRHDDLDDRVRRRLAARFEASNERVSRILGRALPWA